MKNEKLSNEKKISIIEKAILSRVVEEALLRLFSEGKLSGTVHTCIGQEFVGACAGHFYQKGDTIFSNHRCHGHFLSFVGDVEGLIAEIMGRTSGVSGGRGGSQHLCKDGFYSNGIQGGIVPVATGLAMAHKIDNKKNVSICFIGDGTLGEGVLYESLNIASKWNLPLLVILEDNGYSQSTSQHETLAGDILLRAESFGICTFSGDTWNWEELYQVFEQAFDFVRSEQRPCFIKVQTFRLKAHSKGDDDRPKEFVKQYEEKDPLNIVLQQNDDNIQNLYRVLCQKVEDAIKKAECFPFPSPVPITAPFNISDPNKVCWENFSAVKKNRFVKNLNEAFVDIMEKNKNVYFLGEDIESPYGGAFKVSQNLSIKYPQRVINTPISEAAIVGIGCGLSILGKQAFVEIMFGDFSTLIVDQIVNHAAKFNFMYNDQVTANVIIRTPMGGGRGYGPTHSQSLERIFYGIPGLRVLAHNIFLPPQRMLEKLIGEQNKWPTLIIENKLMYAAQSGQEVPAGYEYLISSEEFPTFWLKPKAARIHLTIVAFAGSSLIIHELIQKLFTDFDMIAQCIVPTQLYPFHIGPLSPIFSETEKILIIEEGQLFAGWSAEILAQGLECGLLTNKKIKRIGPSEHSIPASAEWEQKSLPTNIEYVINAAKDFLNGN